MAGVPPATSVVPLEGEGVEGDSGGCVRDSQILSTFAERKLPPVPRAPAPVLVFDACQVGVILRAVLYVEAVIAIGLMYVASGTADWLGRVAVVTGGALPATLLWLVLGCSFKRLLARLPLSLQMATGVVLGALAGVYACGMLTLLGFSEAPPWLASACTGALLAAGLLAGLVWRVRGRTPAATTARLAELQSRIRPHFLFNTLNTAIALVREEPAKAEAVLEDLSDLFRHALTEQGDSSSVGREIELARRYLAIEQVRFGERLQVEWALANVRDRLRLLHDLQGGFRTALVDDVYQARIEVPLPARGER